jgi:hypothetical protein
MQFSVPTLATAATLALAAAGAVTSQPRPRRSKHWLLAAFSCVGAPGFAPPPPAYGYAPYRRAGGYYGGPAYDDDCYMVRRRFVDDWGRVVIRRTRVCE